MAFLQGQLLVASPHLCDPNFFRTVVLMVQHDAEGAFGLVLNRQLERTVAEIWDPLDDGPCECPWPLFCGGPVPGSLIALHDDQELAEDEVLPGVYFANRMESLIALVQSPPQQVRIFTGYSGWGAGQLEGELRAGGWLVAEGGAADVFGDVEEVWRHVSRRINLDILSRACVLKHVPDDPSWN